MNNRVLAKFKLKKSKIQELVYSDMAPRGGMEVVVFSQRIFYIISIKEIYIVIIYSVYNTTVIIFIWFIYRYD